MQAIRRKENGRKINLHLKDAQMKRLRYHTEHEPAPLDQEGVVLHIQDLDVCIL